MSYNSAI